MLTDSVNKPTNIQEQAENHSERDPVEQSVVNGYASENSVEDEEGWTKVMSRKQGCHTSLKIILTSENL